MQASMAPRATAPLFWGTAAAVVGADLVSKLVAERSLPRYVPQEIVGNVVRFISGLLPLRRRHRHLHDGVDLSQRY